MTLVFMIWYRVKAASMPGMTFTEPANGQPAATQDTKTIYRSHGIFRTGGIKTAVLPDKGTQQQTIKLDQTDDESLHFSSSPRQSFSNVLNNSCFVISPALVLLNTTISRPLSCTWCCRKLSRTTRLMRLRATAVLTYRLAIANPSRA